MQQLHASIIKINNNHMHGKSISVPETVQGLNISRLEANSSHVTLSLEWMVSEQ